MSKPEAEKPAGAGRCWETMRRPSPELLDGLQNRDIRTQAQILHIDNQASGTLTNVA